MDANNLVFIEDGNKVTCGGYEIDNELMKNKIPAIVGVQKGGGSLDTLAVPAGLFLLQQHVKPSTKPFILSYEEADEVSDNLYDRLLSLMTTDQKRSKNKSKGTRRKRSKSKRSTRRKR